MSLQWYALKSEDKSLHEYLSHVTAEPVMIAQIGWSDYYPAYLIDDEMRMDIAMRSADAQLIPVDYRRLVPLHEIAKEPNTMKEKEYREEKYHREMAYRQQAMSQGGLGAQQSAGGLGSGLGGLFKI